MFTYLHDCMILQPFLRPPRLYLPIATHRLPYNAICDFVTSACLILQPFVRPPRLRLYVLQVAVPNTDYVLHVAVANTK